MSQIQVQAAIAGGGWRSGGLYVAGGSSVALQLASTVGIGSYIWEIYAFPAAFSLPAGWQNINGVYTYSSGATPPAFNLPALSSTTWGKYAIRCRVNGNPLQYNQDGSLNAAYVADNTDARTALCIRSTNGLEGVFFGESTQFDSVNAYAGAIMRDLRVIDPHL